MKLLYFSILIIFSPVSSTEITDLYRSSDDKNCDALYSESDYIKATPYCEKAAESGSALAMTNLALILRTSNIDKSIKLWEKASNLGNARAMLNLGIHLVDGTNGVKKNKKQGIEWLKKGEDSGNIAAISKLGEVFIKDGAEYSKDEEIYKKLKQASISGSAQASMTLGEGYSHSVNGARAMFKLRTIKAGKSYPETCTSIEKYIDFRFCSQIYLFEKIGMRIYQLADAINLKKIKPFESNEWEKEIKKYQYFKSHFSEKIQKNLNVYIDRHKEPSEINSYFLNINPFVESQKTNNGLSEYQPADVLLFKQLLTLHENSQLKWSGQDEINWLIGEAKVKISHQNSEIIKKDNHLSELLNIASTQKSEKTHEAIGEIYLSGKMVEKDIKKAIHHFKKAVELRDSPDLGYLAELRLSQIYANGVGVKRDGLQAAKYLKAVMNHDNIGADYGGVTKINGVNDACPLTKESDLVCVEASFHHLIMTHLLLSGNWGEEFKKIGETKLKNLINLQQKGVFNDLETRLILASDYMWKNRTKNSDFSRSSIGKAADYLKFKPDASHFKLAPNAPSNSDWINWKNHHNKLSQLIWPEFPETIGEISFYKTKDFKKSESEKPTQWNLPLKSIVISKPGLSKGSYVAYSTEQLSAANNFFLKCGIQLAPKETIAIAAEPMGAVNVNLWKAEDFDNFDELPLARGKQIDWRFDMPVQDTPVLVFFENLGEDEPVGMESDGMRIEGMVLTVNGPADQYFYGSKMPALMYGELDDSDTNRISVEIIAHEIGHLLGLPHSRSFEPSIMSYVYTFFRLPDLLFEEGSMGFSQAECQQMQKSPFLKRIN